MDHIRSLHLFVRSVELGSLTAAAHDMGTTQPTASKALSALEHRMAVRLLERSTTRVTATEQGLRFYDRIKPMLEQYEEALAEARGATRGPEGLLRVNAPVVLGQLHVNRLVQRFLARHAGIEIELILNDRMVDLVDERVDVAIRLGPDLPPNAVARKVGQCPRILVAAPSYMDAHPPVRQPADLALHEYIRFAWSTARIELFNGERRASIDTRGRYRVNNALAIRDALLQGGGIGLCPRWLIAAELRAGTLKRVLPRWIGQPQELHLVTPSRSYRPARAALFLDQMAADLARLPGFTAHSPTAG